MKLKNNKKGFAQLNMIGIAVLALVVGAVITAVGVQVLGSVQTTFVTGADGCNATAKTGCGADYNATVDSISGVSQISTQFPTIGIVVAMVIIIGLIVGGLGFLLLRN